MKKVFLALFISTSIVVSAQEREHFCAKAKQVSAQNLINHSARTSALLPHISHELKYDVKFVHLMLNLERTNKYVQGGVKTVATVTAAAMDTFMCLLHQNHTIDSIRFNGNLMSYSRKDSMLKVKPLVALPNGQSFTVTIYYKGTAPVGGAAIGNGYSNATSGAWGNQVSWSLSEAHAAYHWWPCKQILADKIDSSWVYITTDSTNRVGSNGLLSNVVVVGNKKRYEWKNNHMINYYLISVAIARYKEYNIYAKPQYYPSNDSILIQNYIYDNAINNSTWINGQKVELNKVPQQLNFMSNMFGMYPFHNQKYGHCMAPFSGGMEHQTMTSLGFFEYYLNAHELGHQWWGDNVTCKSWGDIWINEGFASYSEHLTAQYLDPANFASNLNAAHTNVMSQAGGSIFFTGSDTMNATRIFSGRLTYDKGGAIVHTLRFVTNNDSLWFNTLRGFQNTYKNSTASAVDFKNYYQTQTSINITQFFNQWYYGQGYPTFNVTWNFVGNQAIIKSDQTTSMPSSVPLFITPMEYRITRTSAADTIIRVMHGNATETYVIPMLGNMTGVVVDPNNWVINKVIGPLKDVNLVPTGVYEVSAVVDFKISPNPGKGIYTIKGNNLKDFNYTLVDVNGKLIEQGNLGNETINISDKPNGVYFLNINDIANKKTETRKLIKE
ncbi:MAG: T9SS type A sorting domain-containing protein [Bacteroidia bacterium]|nr:T9SS type A sorting domain-containing protein [Bacteroidia bacterium]